MGWNKMKYRDAKHFTFISVSLEQDDFYDDASGNEVANIFQSCADL